MNAVIIHFRGNLRTREAGRQIIIEAEEIKSRKQAGKLIGKKVVYKTGKKQISGKITNTHGNSGALRVRFSRGLPGDAIGKKVEIK